MRKSLGAIVIVPLILLALLMQVYSLWGWLSRDGWLQYILMGEVYALLLVSAFYLRQIIELKSMLVYGSTVVLLLLFYWGFSSTSHTVSTMANNVYYIMALVALIAAIWSSVFFFGSFYALRELYRIKIEKKALLIGMGLVVLAIFLTYFIKTAQLSDVLIAKMWSIDKLRTTWFMLEPLLVLSFSLISIALYLGEKSKDELKRAYVFMGLALVSIGFELYINGLGLVSLRTVIYFLGLFSFVSIIQNRHLVNYVLVSLFIILLFIYLQSYESAPAFYSFEGFMTFLHNALIESIKMFLALYIFIIGWMNVPRYKNEFRLIMVLVSFVAYTYTTQSKGGNIVLYDIVAITAMLKLTALYLIVLYSFYYFRRSIGSSESV